jgi:hypothetical protein
VSFRPIDLTDGLRGKVVFTIKIYLTWTFRPLAPYGGGWPDYRFGRFTHRFVVLDAYCVGDRAKVRAILDVVVRKKVITTGGSTAPSESDD